MCFRVDIKIHISVKSNICVYPNIHPLFITSRNLKRNTPHNSPHSFISRIASIPQNLFQQNADIFKFFVNLSLYSL